MKKPNSHAKTERNINWLTLEATTAITRLKNFDGQGQDALLQGALALNIILTNETVLRL